MAVPRVGRDWLSKNLCEAVMRGRLREARERLEKGEDVNAILMMSRTVLHLAAAHSVEAVELILQYDPDIKKVDLNGFTALHQASYSNIPDSAKITELLVKAGVDLDIKNKFGRSAVDECVLNDNMDSLKVLVTAGAKTESTLRLARAMGRTDKAKAGMIAYLESVSVESVEHKTREDERNALLMRLEELERKEQEEIEEKRKQTKKLLDKEKTRINNHIEKLEKKKARLSEELSKFKKEGDKKITMLVQEMRELEFQLIKKKTRRLSEDELVKCLECPVCLGPCRKQIWQCRAGHIICSDCVLRPEISTCPQCRIPIRYQGQLTRNLAMEDLARKCLPQEVNQDGDQGDAEVSQAGENGANQPIIYDDDDDWHAYPVST